MKPLFAIVTLIAALLVAPLTQALALGAPELRASRSLGCVLAEDALGYLSEEQFNQRFDEAVDGFSEAAVDVIYAKALGYIDGLMFGLAAADGAEARGRLESFSNSQACSRAVSSLGVSL